MLKLYKISNAKIKLEERDMVSHPTKYLFVCPKCGSSVNLSYALKILPTIGISIRDHFYCPCERYQLMEILYITSNDDPSLWGRIKFIFKNR